MAVKNAPHWVLREMGGVGGTATHIDLSDNQAILLGDDDDASIKWDGSNLEILPVAADTGVFAVGDGTTDMDIKWYAGTASDYVLFDVGNKRLHIEGDTKLYRNLNLGAVSGEEHGYSMALTGTLSSGEGMVGDNIAVTTAGTGGAWVSGIYAKVVQGVTKNVNGYISGAEFEVVNAAANVSDWFPLVLNAQNNGSTHGQHASYIALRDYGSLPLESLVWISDVAIATTDAGKLISTAGSPRTHTHSLRFMHQATAYYVMCTSTGA